MVLRVDSPFSPVIYERSALPIPSDLLIMILKNINPIELQGIKLVSKGWCKLICDNFQNSLKVAKFYRGDCRHIEVAKSTLSAFFADSNFLFLGFESGKVYCLDHLHNKIYTIKSMLVRIDFLLFLKEINKLLIVSNHSLTITEFKFKKSNFSYKQTECEASEKIKVSNICPFGSCAFYIKDISTKIFNFNLNSEGHEVLILKEPHAPECLNVFKPFCFRIEKREKYELIAYSFKKKMIIYQFEVPGNYFKLESNQKYLVILSKKEVVGDFCLLSIYEIESGNFLQNLNHNIKSIYWLDDDKALIVTHNPFLYNITTREIEKRLTRKSKDPIIQVLKVDNLILMATSNSLEWWDLSEEILLLKENLFGFAPTLINFDNNILKITLSDGSLITRKPFINK